MLLFLPFVSALQYWDRVRRESQEMRFSFPFFQVLSSVTGTFHRILIPGIQVSWDESWFEGGLRGLSMKIPVIVRKIYRICESWYEMEKVSSGKTENHLFVRYLWFVLFLRGGSTEGAALRALLALFLGEILETSWLYVCFLKEYSNHSSLKWKHALRLWFKENVLCIVSQLV